MPFLESFNLAHESKFQNNALKWYLTNYISGYK